MCLQALRLKTLVIIKPFVLLFVCRFSSKMSLFSQQSLWNGCKLESHSAAFSSQSKEHQIHTAAKLH